MFRENLEIAKAKFTEAVTNRDNFKKMPHATEAQDLLTRLVGDTLAAYGDLGIYDPERLAGIDFLSQPEALVELVREGRTAQQVYHVAPFVEARSLRSRPGVLRVRPRSLGLRHAHPSWPPHATSLFAAAARPPLVAVAPVAQRPRDMELMIEITEEWMLYMIGQGFPPLTPHHTQAFTVMMMARCFIENVPPEVGAAAFVRCM